MSLFYLLICLFATCIFSNFGAFGTFWDDYQTRKSSFPGSQSQNQEVRIPKGYICRKYHCEHIWSKDVFHSQTNQSEDREPRS